MSNTETTKIIEINGVKMEIDLRYAKQIHENIRIGSRVKVLKKEYSTHKVLAGIVVGFENFQKLPTIVVAAFEPYSYSDMLHFFYINADNKETDIVPALDWYPDLGKANSIDLFDRQIQKKKLELEELEDKKAFFIKEFGKYFEAATPDLESQF